MIAEHAADLIRFGRLQPSQSMSDGMIDRMQSPVDGSGRSLHTYTDDEVEDDAIVTGSRETHWHQVDTDQTS